MSNSIKTRPLNQIFVAILCAGWLALWLIIWLANKPDPSTIEMTTNGTNWTTVEPIAAFPNHTFVIPCKLGQWFRISSNHATRITNFLPDTNGLAVIVFTYTK